MASVAPRVRAARRRREQRRVCERQFGRRRRGRRFSRADRNELLFGVVNVTRAALPLLRAQRSGHIIQISSIGSHGARAMRQRFGNDSSRIGFASLRIHGGGAARNGAPRAFPRTVAALRRRREHRSGLVRVRTGGFLRAGSGHSFGRHWTRPGCPMNQQRTRPARDQPPTRRLLPRSFACRMASRALRSSSKMFAGDDSFKFPRATATPVKLAGTP